MYCLGKIWMQNNRNWTWKSFFSVSFCIKPAIHLFQSELALRHSLTQISAEIKPQPVKHLGLSELFLTGHGESHYCSLQSYLVIDPYPQHFWNPAGRTRKSFQTISIVFDLCRHTTGIFIIFNAITIIIRFVGERKHVIKINPGCIMLFQGRLFFCFVGYITLHDKNKK